MYVALQKYLYVYLSIAFLFYFKLLLDMKVSGFRIRPYGLCVANEVISSKEMNITWHVDDNDILNVEESRLMKFIDWFKWQYVNLNISRGDKKY